MTYTIMHKDTKNFFAGFDVKQGNCVWVPEKNLAVRMSLQKAKTQAALMIAQGINVQRKPVAAQ